jgi:hypothetical protein
VVDWQVTATTIFCEDVDDEVTLMVYSDGKLKCTGYKKYGNPDKETARSIKIKSQQMGRQLGCRKIECRHLTQYRDRLLV